MGQVIRLEAARAIGAEIARRPENDSLKKPRVCDMKLACSQLLADAVAALGGRLSSSARDTFERLQRGLEEFDPKDRELRGAVLSSFEQARRTFRESLAKVSCERGCGRPATALEGIVAGKGAPKAAVCVRGDCPPSERLCQRCESEAATVKITATDLDGTLLDGPAEVCRGCATEAGFEVGH
jgi:hypothetical protein